MMKKSVIVVLTILLGVYLQVDGFIIDECTFTPTSTESFEYFEFTNYVPLSNAPILSEFATLVNPAGYTFGSEVWGLGGPNAVIKDGLRMFGNLGNSGSTEITFNSPIASFGGWFGYTNGSPPMTIEFYDSSNDIIETKYFTYDSVAMNGNLVYAGYCAQSAIIKRVVIAAGYHTFDLLSIALESAPITTNGLTTNEMTTGSNIINECTFTPSATESFESFPVSGSYAQFTNSPIFSSKATFTDANGYLFVGDGVWGLGGPSAVVKDGSKMFGHNGGGGTGSTQITFNSPVHSFGGWFAYNNGAPSMSIEFYDSSNDIIETKYFTYSAPANNGNTVYAGYCAQTEIIKRVVITSQFDVMDLLSIGFTEITSGDLSTAELTTNELTTNELTTNELTTEALTTNEFTTNELTTQELTTQELTTQELTTQELTTQELTTQELTTQELTTEVLTTSQLTSNGLTSGTPSLINECTFTPTATESFESFPVSGSYAVLTNAQLFLSKATLTDSNGYVFVGSSTWGLGGPSAVVKDGVKMFGHNGAGGSGSTQITFNSPVHSFGGWFAYNNGAPPMSLSFYDSSNNLIETKYFTYNVNANGGNTVYAGYCAQSEIIKRVVITSHFQVLDLLSIGFTEITSGDLSTAELTTNELTTNELTTNELTTNELTTNELTTNELTTNELTTNELTTNELTTNELTTEALTTNEFTTNELTTEALTTEALTTSYVTSGLASIINECSFSPTSTESFESFGNIVPATNVQIFSSFANLVDPAGYTFGNGVWGLGGPNAVVKDGARMFGHNGGDESQPTTITFSSPVHSFGGWFAYNNGAPPMSILFYDSSNNVIETKYFTYSATANNGNTVYAGYCAQSEIIKKITIHGSFTIIDLLSVGYVEITSSALTTNSQTSSDITSSSVTSHEVTSNGLTTQELTTQELTTQELTTQELTTQELTTQELTTESITSSEMSTSEITSNELSTSFITTAPVETGNNEECVDSSDCEDQGVCTENGYCSCYSGFGGSVCDNKPASVCSSEYSELSSDIARFKPEVGVSFENSIVKMIIKAPLESTMYENPSNDHSLVASNEVYSLDTTIKFIGVGSESTECNYPNGLINDAYSWVKPFATDAFENDDSDCSDIYTLDLPWSLFRSSCDIQKLSDNVFGQALEISRNYAVPFEGDYITRTETLRRNIEFRFPDFVDISSNVGVVAPSTLSVSAILSVRYNIQSDRWTVTIITDTIRPFRLTSPVVTSDDTTEDRIESVTITQYQQSTTRQTVVIEIDSCYSVNAVLTVSLIAECYIPEECAAENDKPVTLTATVQTGNACPLVHTIALSTSSLSSFSDSSLTQSQGIFASNSLAYFTANIDSDEATITSKQLETVCISLNSGTCNSVLFTTIATQSDSPSFSISLSSLNGLAQDGDVVTLKVRVGIEWEDTNKRSIQTFDVALNSQFIIRDNNNNNVIISTTNSAISTGVSIIVLFACLVSLF